MAIEETATTEQDEPVAAEAECGEGCGCGVKDEGDAEAELGAQSRPAAFAGPAGFAAVLAQCARMFEGGATRVGRHGFASMCGWRPPERTVGPAERGER